MPLVYAGLLLLAALPLLAWRAHRVYEEVRRDFRRVAGETGFAYGTEGNGRPTLTGGFAGRGFRVDLVASRRLSLPDTVRVTWGGRVHHRVGLTLSGDELGQILGIMGDAERQERAHQEAGATDDV